MKDGVIVRVCYGYSEVDKRDGLVMGFKVNVLSVL